MIIKFGLDTLPNLLINIDGLYSCGQIKLGSNFWYCKSELNIKSPEKIIS
jgi:hypothetical protein